MEGTLFQLEVEVMFVMFQPCDNPATLPTCVGRMQDLNHTQDMPSEADIRLWTHGDDDEDDATVRAMLGAPEDAEEDPQEAFKQRLHCGGAYVEEIIDD